MASYCIPSVRRLFCTFLNVSPTFSGWSFHFPLLCFDRFFFSRPTQVFAPSIYIISPFLLGGLEPIGLLALVGEHGSVIPDTLYYEGLCPKTGWWWTSMGLAEVDGMYQLPRWLYKIQNKTDSTDIDS